MDKQRKKHWMALATGVLLTVSATAGAPAGWRGDGSGRFSGSLPVATWNSDTGENIAWRTGLPRTGNASPVPVADCVIVTGEPNWLYALNASDGKVKWATQFSLLDLPDASQSAKALIPQRDEKNALEVEIWEMGLQVDELSEKDDDAAAKKAKELKQAVRDKKKRLRELDGVLEEATGTRGQKWKTIGYAMSTPVTDGASVWAKYATGVIGCVSLSGTRAWVRRSDYDGTETSVPSPLLCPVEDRQLLIFARVPYDANRSYRNEKTERSKIVAALDAATGATVWETAPLRNAGWGAGGPILVSIGDTRAVVTGGGDVLRADTGAVLASGVGMGGASTAVAGDGVVYFCDDKAIEAVRLTGAPGGVAHESLWRTVIVEESDNSHGLWSSPILHDGHLYAVEGLGRGFVLSATDGLVATRFEPFSHNTRKSEVYGSLAFADGKIFVFELKKGYGAIIAAKPTADIIAQLGPLGDAVYSSPAIHDGRLYVRSSDAVFCIGTP